MKSQWRFARGTMRSVKIGAKFGRWKVKKIFKSGPFRFASVVCKCGAVRKLAVLDLVRGQSLSCGCWQKDLLLVVRREREKILKRYGSELRYTK
jgi:hypothetical protein